MKSTRPFFILWGGQAISLIGSQSVQFALIWWLTVETGSATVLATASLLGLLPPVLLGPLIGALVDRSNRKLVMLASDAGIAVVSAGLALAFLFGAATVELIFGILLIRAIGAAFHAPAMLASTTLMVPEERLTAIQGMNQALQGGMLIVSAPLGALLIGQLALPAILLVDVISALVAIVPLLFIHVPQPSTSPSESAGSGLWSEITAGFGYLWKRPGHLALLGLASMVNLFLIPAFSLLPLLILEELKGDAMQLGWANSAFGVGTIAGGVLLGVWGGFQRRITTSLVALFALGLAVLAVGATPASFVFGATISMLLVGLTVPSVNGPIAAIMQATVAPDYQGRIFTLMGSVAGITAPLGLLLAAPAAELFGVRIWYVAGAVACMLMGGLAFLVPSIRDIEGESVGAEVTPEEPASSVESRGHA